MARTVRIGLLGLILGGLMMSDSAQAGPDPDEPQDAAAQGQAASSGKANLPTPTLGGSQFWGDVRFVRGWKIQQNVFTGHHRLLDPGNVRRAWGAREACEVQLDEVIRTEKLEPMSGTAVILLHGAIRSSKSMRKLGLELARDGYLIVPFDYPSTKAEIETSADYLQQVIEGLDGVTRIHFVVHSMGGLVVRSWSGRYGDKRAGRLVMIGVPNRGARMADHLKTNLLFKLLYGQAGQQLSSDPKGFISRLPTPEFEFAVIAGKAGSSRGFNPLVPGDDDGTVAVESTRLPGATDFISVRGGHSFLMFKPQVIEWTRRYLKHGHFREDGIREPIPVEKKDDANKDDANKDDANKAGEK
jgi:pimeloyl-ACP methyl ester carboxylesterase